VFRKILAVLLGLDVDRNRREAENNEKWGSKITTHFCQKWAIGGSHQK
jgi:hypothetical protein